MIAVQTISTSWTKQSRGGELATMRGRIQKQLTLRLPDKDSPLIWHSVVYSERNRFTEPVAVELSTACVDNRFGCTNAEVELHNDSATLIYRYQTGAPTPQFFAKTGASVAVEHAIEIPQNCWASIEYNARFTSLETGNWWYEHVVVNVAVGTCISPNVFLATRPLSGMRNSHVFIDAKHIATSTHDERFC